MIEDRVRQITAVNPWLSSRLKIVSSGVKAIYNSQAPRDIKVKEERLRKFNAQSYQAIVDAIAPFRVKTGRECVDTSEFLFKVTLLTVPSLSGGDIEAVVIVVSLSAVLGDVHTYYQILNMLQPSADLTALIPERIVEHPIFVKDHLGKAENDWLGSGTFRMGEVLSKLTSMKSVANVYEVDTTDYIQQRKTESKQEYDERVSTHDILTSWFMAHCGCTTGLMYIDFRWREERLTASMAGNYSHRIIYRPDDYQRPGLIRRSIQTLQRCGRHPQVSRRKESYFVSVFTPLPGIVSTLRNNTALVSNWKTSACSLRFQNCSLIRHLPVIDFQEEPYKNYMVVFSPMDGKTGVIISTRHRYLKFPIEGHHTPLWDNLLTPEYPKRRMDVQLAEEIVEKENEPEEEKVKVEEEVKVDDEVVTEEVEEKGLVAPVSYPSIVDLHPLKGVSPLPPIYILPETENTIESEPKKKKKKEKKKSKSKRKDKPVSQGENIASTTAEQSR